MSDPTGSLNFRLLHVGVAVPSLAPAAQVLSDLFGYRVKSGPFTDPIQKVQVNFLVQSDDDASSVELIAPASEDSPIQSLLTKNGGAYHLCFETSDLDAALTHVQSLGCVIVAQPVPAVAFDGRRIAWIYAPTRQLFELVEARRTE